MNNAASRQATPAWRRFSTTLIAGLTLYLLSTILMASGQQTPDQLRVGVDPTYPPFSSLGDAGQLQGFDIDIAKALCHEVKMQCTFVEQNWDGLIPGLRDGKFDAIISSMSITEKRRQLVAFTDPYYRTAVRHVSKKDSGFNPEHLTDQKIGVMRATVASDWLEENLENPSAIQLFPDSQALFDAIDSGHVDAVFGDAIGFVKWLEVNAEEYEFVGDEYFLDEGIGIALRKEDEDLRLLLNGAIQAILEDGTYAGINARYFDFDLYNMK
ncbi:MAG: transporter substrate-binding domain-containing protein [Gammaproteobacteria bacterium]|nr:transporter substrate-binding domain-containing protein [Gammaproteobacteria bacterium]